MRLFSTAGLGLAAVITAACASAQPLQPDPGRDAFVTDLMGKMTIEEKIGQLNLLSVGFDITGPIVSGGVGEKVRKGLVGAVLNTYTPTATHELQALAVNGSRLKIPLLFGYDVIHGHKTIFPIPLGLAATWDMAAIEQSARIAAAEASADGLHWTYAPMVDIARDPRWGRICEGAGEDPYLGAQIARAQVRGFQGESLGPQNILACVKHFALYGAAEGGRDYNTADMSRMQMLQDYLPPYKAAVEAGAASVMTSFNVVDSVPATANQWLLTDLLRRQWGFNGFVVTDYTSINEMTQHGMGDLKQCALLALKAGVDMDMVGETFTGYAKKLLDDGSISEALINDACRRILEAKYSLGLFSDPYRGCTPERAARDIFTIENRKAARETATRSFVLLKNAGQALPLKRSGVIALVGPLAASQRDLIGSWSAAGEWKHAVTVLEGITNAAGSGVRVLYAKGANITDDPDLVRTLEAFAKDNLTMDKRSPAEMVKEAVAAARKADVVVAVLGEAQCMSGEAASRSDPGLPENQKELLKALVATGKPVVLVLMNGRPLTLTWEDAHCAAILETWFGGTEAGNAIADVLFGTRNPSGKLTVSFPRSVGQVPVYYNHKNTGRPFSGDYRTKYLSRYLDVANEPLYPFGHGLSYTAFSCGDVRLSRKALSGDETLEAAVTVSNTGAREGEETVQLYITDPVASVSRSVIELKGFQKIALKPGESREVVFKITTGDLKFYNSQLKYDWEPGEFIIRIGASSAQLKSASVRWAKPSAN